MPFRVGLGQDSHRFSHVHEKKPLMLGGIKVEGHLGLKGNSDADVILHALFNSLAQIIGWKSIGSHADKLCKEDGITDSKEYLKEPLKKLKEMDYEITTVGITIECRKPKIDPVSDEIRKSIAKILGIEEDQVGIIATTGERLTSFGKGEGIQVFAVITAIHKSIKKITEKKK
ncbi:2-C-methyl-D-erythritol 2,4-cyclodiphosphate synthase [Candidatus Micrarchaeota archaeon]|nr:2-C-methyl-D-erythritol 2,4-cyclodiphosphate synthase [Candidatus Micrarchaeota archaeon]